jgi:hypothetical protein
VSIYEKRHLRKHRRLLPLQAGEFASSHDALQLMPHGSGSDEQMFGAE